MNIRVIVGKCLFSMCYLLFSLIQTSGYPMFLSEIPNGNSVPDPCPGSSDKIFLAVGHWRSLPHLATFTGNALFNPFERNPFGEDFKRNSTWSHLCGLDSDGDGRTNGEELGDPDCVWVPGDEPSGVATSHPGIKEIFRDNNTTEVSLAILPRLDCDASSTDSVLIA